MIEITFTSPTLDIPEVPAYQNPLCLKESILAFVGEVLTLNLGGNLSLAITELKPAAVPEVFKSNEVHATGLPPEK